MKVYYLWACSLLFLFQNVLGEDQFEIKVSSSKVEITSFAPQGDGFNADKRSGRGNDKKRGKDDGEEGDQPPEIDDETNKNGRGKAGKRESRRRKGDLKFKLEGRREAFKSEMKFETETHSGTVEKEIENDIKLSVEEIIEFIPGPGAPGYKGEPPLSVYPPKGKNWEWNDMVHDQDGTFHTFTLATKDNVFSVIAKYSEADSGDLTPDQIKMDYKITNFNFTQPGQSKLAFRCKARSKNKIKTKDFGDQKFGTDVDRSVVQGRLEWVDIAESDGEAVKIVTTVVGEGEDEDGKGPNVFYTIDSLNGASNILWDPSFTVEAEDGLNVVAIVLGTLSGLSVVAIGLIKRNSIRNFVRRKLDQHSSSSPQKVTQMNAFVKAEQVTPETKLEKEHHEERRRSSHAIVEAEIDV